MRAAPRPRRGHGDRRVKRRQAGGRTRARRSSPCTRTFDFVKNADVLEAQLDVVFLALPHGQSQDLVPSLLERGVQVVDLGADFRLKSASDVSRTGTATNTGARTCSPTRCTDSSNAIVTNWTVHA